MMKTLITTTVLALGLGFLGTTPSFAGGYIVNGHAASPAEAQALVASGLQQGGWVVNGYGIARTSRARGLHRSGCQRRSQWQEVLLCARRAAVRLSKVSRGT